MLATSGCCGSSTSTTLVSPHAPSTRAASTSARTRSRQFDQYHPSPGQVHAPRRWPSWPRGGAKAISRKKDGGGGGGGGSIARKWVRRPPVHDHDF